MGYQELDAEPLPKPRKATMDRRRLDAGILSAWALALSSAAHTEAWLWKRSQLVSSCLGIGCEVYWVCRHKTAPKPLPCHWEPADDNQHQRSSYNLSLTRALSGFFYLP